MTAWDLLSSGDWLGAITTGYTDILGGWFYVIIAFAVIGAVYLKTESMESASILMLLLGAVGITSNYFAGVGAGAGNLNMIAVWFGIMLMGLSLPIYKFFARRE